MAESRERVITFLSDSGISAQFLPSSTIPTGETILMIQNYSPHDSQPPINICFCSSNDDVYPMAWRPKCWVDVSERDMRKPHSRYPAPTPRYKTFMAKGLLFHPYSIKIPNTLENVIVVLCERLYRGYFGNHAQ